MTPRDEHLRRVMRFAGIFAPMSIVRALLPVSNLGFSLLLAMTVLLMQPSAVGAQSTPPDVVRLRDGTFLRGTIAERSRERVIIVLLTGETRTYPMFEVQSAGPAPAQAATSVPQPSYGPPMLRLRVTSDQQALSLQQLVGTTTVTRPAARCASISSR